MLSYPIRFVVMLMILMHGIAQAQSISSGFEALGQYDFFKAKAIFTKKIKKNPAAAYFGLAAIRYDKLNHFHSLDTAYLNILSADSAWNLLDVKRQIDLWEFGLSDTAIVGKRHQIEEAAFQSANLQNSPEGYRHFRLFYTTSDRIDEAAKLEVARAFFLADSTSSSEALSKFIETYPEAEQKAEALRKLDDALFLERTQTQTVEQYASFIHDFPNSRHVGEADDAMYFLLAPKRSTAELYAFVKAWPKNRNAEEAWELIYADYTSDQRVESFELFKKAFPEYPYPERLQRDVKLAGSSLYPAVDGELWGFVDSTGKLILSYQFEEAWSFSENLAMVRLNDKIGYINKAGIKVVPPKYNDGEPFTNQLAIVEQDGFYGLIDPRGNVVLPIQYDMVSGPANGFYQISKEEGYGFADRFGKIRVKPIYENAEDFSDGLAAVTYEGRIGFIDTTGNLQIPFRYEDVHPFELGFARVMKNDLVGLIDVQGNEIIPIKNDRIGIFHEGLARVTRDGKCAYFDRGGNKIIDFQTFCSSPVLGVDGFSEGLARVEKKGKKGYINKKGKLVIPMQYEESGYFSSGRTPFRKRNKWGYISALGKVVAEAKYDEAYPYIGNFARVKKGEKLGIVALDGSLKLVCEWDEIQVENGVYIMQKDEKFQLFDSSLVALTECVWDDIRRSDDPQVYRLTRADKMALYHIGTRLLFWEEK